MKFEESVWHSIVRLAPDPMRQETANVAVIVASKQDLVVRAIKEPTAQVRAIAPPSVQRLVFTLESSLRSLLESGSPDEALAQLAADGLGGFVITQPKLLLMDPRRDTIGLIADTLFHDYAQPRRWARSAAEGQRVESRLRDLVRKADVPRDRIALGLVVRGVYAKYRFPLAYANGRATIVQAVDLDVTKDSQEQQTRETISNLVETDKLLHQMKTHWITVIQPGSRWHQFEGRLRSFSETLLIDDVSDLVKRIAAEVDHPIEDAFGAVGIEAQRKVNEVVIGFGAPQVEAPPV